MKYLKNWDNNTWLSSKKYVSSFLVFLNKKKKLNKNSKILDLGCGRANIISNLQKKFGFKNKAIGLDIIKNDKIKKNIIFKKTDIINYLKKNNEKYDLIIIKQTIHFFSKNKLITLLSLVKNKLNHNGTLLIFSLKTKNNKIPCFKKMKIKLNNSLKRDELLLKVVKKRLKKTGESYFNFKVNISKRKYINMVRDRYISCLLNISKKDLNLGISEIKYRFKNQIRFTDTLKCISFRK
tara:strand:- start:744 stop:1454 length:711 start_codon:yes stop_codon:yes gene_type:complete